MKITRFYLIALIGLLLSCSKQEEYLTHHLPDGYTIASQSNNERIRTLIFVPDGESTDKFSEMYMATTSFRESNVTLEQKYEHSNMIHSQNCSNGEVLPFKSSNGNGFQSITWVRYCTQGVYGAMPKADIIKLIKGGENEYRIHVILMSSPTDDKLAKWHNYLNNVVVCNASSLSDLCNDS